MVVLILVSVLHIFNVLALIPIVVAPHFGPLLKILVFLVILVTLVTLATLNTLVILVFLVNILKANHPPFLTPHVRQTIIIAKVAIILRLNDLLPYTLAMLNALLLPLVPLKINHLELLPQYKRLFLLLPLLLVKSIQVMTISPSRQKQTLLPN